MMNLCPSDSDGYLRMNVKLILADVQLLIQILVIAVVCPVEGYVGKGLQSRRS